MRKRVFKIIFALLLPVVMILTAGFFSFNETSIAFASVPGKTDENPGGDPNEGGGSSSGGTVASDGLGGLIYVGNNSTFNMTSGSLSGGTAKNGGGVYVSSGGTFNLSGGTVMGNVASTNGNQIYNDGTFTMTGGTVGQKTYLTRVDENGVKNANGNYVLFGSYPQTIKASDVTIDETNVDANGYYLGSDGERYLKLRALSTQARWFTDCTEIEKNTDYYFKVKPILWKITKIENGKALLVAKDVLEYKEYGYNNGYYGSSIRSWLNNDFYNTAFSSKEQELIEISTIECETSSGNTTVNDKIYLLSSGEVQAKDIVPLSEQPKIANDIVRCKGATLSTENGSLIAELTTYWFCRDVYDIDDGMYMGVFGDGGCGFIYDSISGIVPALSVNIGDSSNVSSNGIYNTGDLNIYGGTVYDDIFSSSTIKTKVGASINGIINLSDSGQVIILDYVGETPNYTICVDSSKTAGIIVTFKGFSTVPDISKINVYGYNANGMKVVLQESASGFWVLELVDDKVEFPSTWQTEIASSKYMTSPVDFYDDYYGVALYFVTEMPIVGAVKIGTLSTGIEVYRVNYSELYFVSSLKIYAPEDCSKMFASGAYSAIYFYNFYTENVKSMKNMFSGTINLKTLYISGFNTQNVTDMSGMFKNCTATSLNLKNFDTSNVTNMNSMFWSVGASSLDLSSFNTSNVTDMGHMFMNFLGASLDVTGFDTSNVTSMFSMFDTCSLTSINVKNFNTSNVTDMSYMFNGCTELSSIDLSNFDTSKVTSMCGMFNRCQALTAIDLSNFDTSKVTNMQQMFNDCSVLKNLDISNFQTAEVINMERMFSGCSALTSLNLSYFNTSKVDSFNNMFYGCVGLKYLNLSSFYMSKTTSFSNMLNFGANNAIETFQTPYGNTSALPITTSVTLYDKSGAVVSSVPAKLVASITLSSVPFPVTFPTDWKTQLTGSTMTTTIVAENLTSIAFEKSVPDGYTQIGTIATAILVYKSTSVDTDIVFVYAGKIKAPVDSSSLFSGLVNLVNLTFNNFDTSDTTNMYRMFMFAKSSSQSGFIANAISNPEKVDTYNTTLETLDLSMFDTLKVTDMSAMFYGCVGLKTLDCSSFDMSNVTNWVNMFYFTTDNNIKTLKLPYNNTGVIPITTGSTLIDKDGNTVTSVPANNKQGLSYVASKNKIKITFVIEGRNVGGGLVSIYDKNGNKLVYFDSPEQFTYTEEYDGITYSHFGMKQIGQTIEVDEGTTWYDILNEYGLVCTDTNKSLSYGSVYGSTWTTDQMKNLGTYWNQSEDNPTFNEDITLIFYCGHTCMSSDTEIDVYDEKRKRRIRKKLRDISYKDKLLVWNFDKGCFDLATPLFITKPQTTTRYTMVWFSDGSSLRLVGADDTRRHRVFCLETGKFEYIGNGAKVGMTTYNDKGEFVKITKIEFINEKIEFMNIITNEHFNCFANGILTSCKLSNMYPIKDMKYDKANKTLNTRDMFGDISDFYYKALRLAEQPLLNTYNDHSEYIDYKQIYEIEWENSSFKRDEK